MHRLCIIMCVNDISCGCTIYDCTAAVIVTQHHCCADRERKTLTVLITCTEHKLNTVSYWLNGNISHSLLDVIFCVLQYQEKVLIIETNIDLFHRTTRWYPHTEHSPGHFLPQTLDNLGERLSAISSSPIFSFVLHHFTI